MAGVETLEVFINSASSAQASVFAASCVERAAPLLFWEVSRHDRTVDLGTYRAALDLLWDPRHATAELDSTRTTLEQLPELVKGDEAGGAAAFAYQAAVGFHAALAPHSAEATKVRECSSVLRNFAFRLGRRCGADLLSSEDEAQGRDVKDIARLGDLASGPVPTLEVIRNRSAAHGRESLSVAVSYFAGTV